MNTLAAVQPVPLRVPSGLPGVPDLAWGTHLCQFYRTAEDLASTLVPYFEAGLAGGERCLWITAEPFGAAAAAAALGRVVPDLTERVGRGQIEILDYDEWYLRNARLTTEQVLDQWLEREREALAAGYQGLRITGNTSWLRRGDWAAFDAYEHRVDQAFQHRRIVAVCSYSLAHCSIDEVLDVVRRHGLALARRDGEWSVIRSATETLAAVTEPAAAAEPGGEGSPPAPTVHALASELGARTRALQAEASLRSAAELERDRWRSTSRAASSHLGRLQRVTSALLGARSREDHRAVLGTMAEATGASAAVLAARQGGGVELVAHAGEPADLSLPGLLELLARERLEALLGAERPVLLGSPEAIAGRWPGAPRGAVAACAALPLEAGGVPRGVLVFGFATEQRFAPADQALLDDLARQAALALERVQLLADLERARVRAEEGSRAKDEFLAMLGHELRNPLSPMGMVLHLMARRAPDVFRSERAVLERQLRHMEHLVSDLLDVSRIARGKLQLERERLELGRVVAEALELAAPAIEARHHRLEVAVPASGLPLDADPHRLVQAVVNLLTNAAKYTPAGGRIAVAARAAGGIATLSVEDDGQGIEPELAGRVFELFEQGPRGLARSEGGLGLGLAITRSIVELHGGAVRVRSDGRGKGSTFTIELPLATGPERLGGDGGEPLRCRAGRVLVADDNEDAAATLADVLRCSGCEVVTAHDGPSALEAARTHLPDVAILDIGLPGLDGWALAEQLRAQRPERPPHLVAVTGYGLESDRERSRAAGFVAHLVKPIDVERLERIVAGLVAARDGEPRG